MLQATFRRQGWMFLIRGILAIAFGVLAIIWPTITIEALVYLFGAYVLVEGIFRLISLFNDRATTQSRIVSLLEGVLDIALGILTFLFPAVVALSLIVIIGIWAIVTGILEIAAAIRLRKVIENEFWLGLGGVLSIVAGILLLLQPGVGALALVWLIGGYAILFGMILIALAFRFFSRARQEGPGEGEADRSTPTATPSSPA